MSAEDGDATPRIMLRLAFGAVFAALPIATLGTMLQAGVVEPKAVLVFVLGLLQYAAILVLAEPIREVRSLGA